MTSYQIEPQLTKLVYLECDGDINKAKNILKKLDEKDFKAICNWFSAAYFAKNDTLGLFNVKNLLEGRIKENFDYLVEAPIKGEYKNFDGNLLKAEGILEKLKTPDIEKITVSFLNKNIEDKKYEQFLINLLGTEKTSPLYLSGVMDSINTNFSELLPLLYQIEKCNESSSIDKAITSVPKLGNTQKPEYYQEIIQKRLSVGVMNSLTILGRGLSPENIEKLRRFYYQKHIEEGKVDSAYRIGVLLGNKLDKFAIDVFNGQLLEERLGDSLNQFKEDEQKKLREIFSGKNIEILKNNYEEQKCIDLAYRLYSENDIKHLSESVRIGIEKEGVKDDFLIELFNHFYKNGKGTEHFKKLYDASGIKEPSEELVLVASYYSHVDAVVKSFNESLAKEAEPDEKTTKKLSKIAKKIIRGHDNLDYYDAKDIASLLLTAKCAEESVDKLLKSKLENPITGELEEFNIETVWTNVYMSHLTGKMSKSKRYPFFLAQEVPEEWEEECDCRISKDEPEIIDTTEDKPDIGDIRDEICNRLVKEGIRLKAEQVDHDGPFKVGNYLTALLNAHEKNALFNDGFFSHFNNPGYEIGQFLKKNRKLKISEKHGNGVGAFMQGELIAEEDVGDIACVGAKGGKALFKRNVGDDCAAYARNLEIIVDGEVGKTALKGAKKVRAYFNGDVGDGLGEGSKKCRVIVKGELGEISEDMLSGDLTYINKEGRTQYITCGSASRKCGYGAAGLLGAGAFLTTLFGPFGLIAAGAGGVSAFFSWAFGGRHDLDEHNNKVKKNREEELGTSLLKEDISWDEKLKKLAKIRDDAKISADTYNGYLQKINAEKIKAENDSKPFKADLLKQKCPACCMQVDIAEKICPVCGTDFAKTPATPVAASSEQRPVVKRIVRKPIKKIMIRKPVEELAEEREDLTSKQLDKLIEEVDGEFGHEHLPPENLTTVEKIKHLTIAYSQGKISGRLYDNNMATFEKELEAQPVKVGDLVQKDFGHEYLPPTHLSPEDKIDHLTRSYAKGIISKGLYERDLDKFEKELVTEQQNMPPHHLSPQEKIDHLEDAYRVGRVSKGTFEKNIGIFKHDLETEAAIDGDGNNILSLDSLAKELMGELEEKSPKEETIECPKCSAELCPGVQMCFICGHEFTEPGSVDGLTEGKKGRTDGLTDGSYRLRKRDRTDGLTDGINGRTDGLTDGIRSGEAIAPAFGGPVIDPTSQPAVAPTATAPRVVKKIVRKPIVKTCPSCGVDLNLFEDNGMKVCPVCDGKV